MCLSSSFSSIGNLSSLVKGLLRLVVRVKIPGGGAPFDSMYSPSSSLWGTHTHTHRRTYTNTFTLLETKADVFSSDCFITFSFRFVSFRFVSLLAFILFFLVSFYFNFFQNLRSLEYVLKNKDNTFWRQPTINLFLLNLHWGHLAEFS